MPEPDAPPPNVDGLIEVTVGGNAVQMTRGDWWNLVESNLADSWHDGPALYRIALGALDDRIHELLPDRVLAIAHQTAVTHPDPESGYALYATVARRTGHLDLARETCEAYLAEHGPNGTIVTNLAQVLAESGDLDGAEQTMRRALDLDPNLEVALLWLWGHIAERDGKTLANAVFETAAQHPEAWRPQLELGDDLAAAGDLDGAWPHYSVVAQRCRFDEPLWRIANQLGFMGRPDLSVHLILPVWRPAEHFADLGFTLARAATDSQRFDDARTILDQIAKSPIPYDPAHHTAATDRLDAASGTKKRTRRRR